MGCIPEPVTERRQENGFRLSAWVRSSHDYNVLTRQANGRRVLPEEPEQSLILLKPTMQVLQVVRFQQILGI